MAYPASLDSFTTKVDGVDTYYAAHVNDIQTAIVNVETELGTDPAGSATDLTTRLAKSLAGDGSLNFAASALLTISGGAITATQNWHRVDTESNASTDNLDTIAAAADGYVLLLRIVADARNVVIRHNIGNILCTGGGNITLDLQSDLAILVYDSIITKWVCTAMTAGATLAGNNTWTGNNIFSKSIATAYALTTINLTVTDAMQTIAGDATSGNITITLPDATGCVGRRYDVIKIDSSANTVAIATTSSQTINGSTTKLISTQYTAFTVISNGANWWII